MAQGNPVGAMFVELSLDATKYTAAQKRILAEAQKNSADINRVFRVLGTQTDEMFNATRQQAQNAYNAITKSAKSSADEIRRAHEGLTKKLKQLDEEQFGKRTSMLEGFKKNWLAAAAIMAGITGAGIKIWDMAKVGAGFDEQTGILDNLAKKYKTTANTIIDEMDRASKYQIAKSELMTIALGGIAKGLNPEQLINLANAAETLGDVVSKTATEALKELTEALETGRTRGLKSYLGAAIDLETTFGDLASKMTAVEKAQAMYNVTMLAAIDIQSQQNKETDTAADKIANIEKRFDDATLSASRFFKTLVVGALEALQRMSDILDVMHGVTSAEDIGGFQTEVPGAPFARMPMPTQDTTGKAAAKHQEQIDKLKEQLKARKDLTEAEAKAKKESDEAARKAQAFANEQQKAYQKAYESQAKLMAQGYYDDLVDGEKEATKQLERLADEQIKFGKESEEVFEKIAKKNEEATKKMEKDWEHFWENVQDFTADAFYDLFTNIWDGWSNLLDRMKEWFLKWVAEIAAKQVVIQLQGAMSSGGGGGNNILSQLMSLGSSASSGSSMFGGSGDMFGLSSLFSSGVAIQGGATTGVGAGGAFTGAEALMGSSYAGAGAGTAGGGALGAAGGVAFAALPFLAGLYISGQSRADDLADPDFQSFVLGEAFRGTEWQKGSGLSHGSSQTAKSRGVSWNSEDWWNQSAEAAVSAFNAVADTLNAQMMDFLKMLPDDMSDAIETALSRQNWDIVGVGNIGSGSQRFPTKWNASEMEKEINSAISSIAGYWGKIVTDVFHTNGMKLEDFLAQYSAHMQWKGQMTQTWDQFVMGLKTSDLAPVQSMETFAFYYSSLMDKVKANPNDTASINSLLQYTSGSYLPFMKSYMGGGGEGDYSTIFNSIIMNQGELYNTVFSSIDHINQQFDELFDYVKELLNKTINVDVNINGDTVAEAVITSIESGNVVPSQDSYVNWDGNKFWTPGYQPTWDELGGGP